MPVQFTALLAAGSFFARAEIYTFIPLGKNHLCHDLACNMCGIISARRDLKVAVMATTIMHIWQISNTDNDWQCASSNVSLIIVDHGDIHLNNITNRSRNAVQQRRKRGPVCWQTERTDGSSVVCEQTAGGIIQSV